MRKLIVGLGALIIPAFAAGLAVTGCDEASNSIPGGDICGPCGSVVQGDVGISGDARLDGFFSAVADLGKATGSINGNFEANLGELEAVFGLVGEGEVSGRIDLLIEAIKAEIAANVQGDLKVVYAPPQCSASLDIAVEAQANCEAKADCTASAEPPSVSVECSGECTGSCSGGCSASATAKCEFTGPSVTCTGACEGTCNVEMNAAATCEGTCNGTCNGTCSATDANGKCTGSCTGGTCQGSCSLKGEAAADCNGTCSGSCTMDAPEGGCAAEATAKCEGGCEGSCSGGCTGEATPPTASVDCEATADCQASASAQGSANLECTPPSLDVQLNLADLDASAQAEFLAKIDALKVKGAAMIQGLAQYKALFTGELEGGGSIEPPVAKIQTEIEGLVNAAATGSFEFDIPAGRLLCVPAALNQAVTMMGTMASEASGNISAQAKFASAFTGGFKS